MRKGLAMVCLSGVVVGVLVAGPAGATTTHFTRAGRGHLMPRRTSEVLTRTASSARQLSDYGGQVISSAKIYLVRWGATGTYFPQVSDGTAASFFSS